MNYRCVRCRQKINAGESTFVALLDKHAGKLDYRIERAMKVPSGSHVLHLNGDPQCGKEVSGFRLELLRTIGLPEDLDIAFLDYV